MDPLLFLGVLYSEGESFRGFEYVFELLFRGSLFFGGYPLPLGSEFLGS